jgi:predicted Na+-dependent transporter
MPALGYGAVKALDLSKEFALGVVLVSTAPGGVASNIFTYYAQADVSLSISLSVISTFVAIGAMPLLIFLLVEQGNLDVGDLDVPYLNIVLTLALLIIPVICGIEIRRRNAHLAHTIEKIGAAVGTLFLVGAYVYVIMENTDAFDQSLGRWILAFVQQPISSGLGAALAALLGLDFYRRATICIETGVQNVALILAMVSISFSAGPKRDDIIAYPIMYAVAYIPNSIVIILAIRYLRQKAIAAGKLEPLVTAAETVEDMELHDAAADDNATADANATAGSHVHTSSEYV